MADGPTDGAAASAPPQRQQTRSLQSLLSRRNIGIVGIALVLLVGIIFATRYHSGSERRRYEAMLAASLDKIVTAQEGFFYDSTRYVASLRALPTVTLPVGVHVTLHSPDRRSWWGVATHDRLPDHHCVVWVGTAPTSLPSEARAPENETKPLCFDDKNPVARQASRS
ncbi:MAG TPA: hypothetical protein VFD67_09800 [Gemmatimonadaceae bacterium]|nr:hypothetical protein [Gemmatimonadaceae bacterium]